MGLRIAKLICNERSAFLFGRLLCLCAAATPVGSAQSPPAGYVHDCRPCMVQPGPKAAQYSASFVTKSSGEDRWVTAIDIVNLSTKATQRLQVTGMDPVDRSEDFFFKGVDINFDGLLDMMLVVRRGGANASAAYWIFDERQGTFSAIGTYPVFRVDSNAKQLSTYERGGQGGMVHEAKKFAFMNGKLTLVSEEKQVATGQNGVFRKTVTERVNGAMKVVSVESVRAAK